MTIKDGVKTRNRKQRTKVGIEGKERNGVERRRQ